MEAHQERVIEEKRELDERLEKLNNFFNTQTFKDLHPLEKERMRKQIDYMNGYSRILGERITAFRK